VRKSSRSHDSNTKPQPEPVREVASPDLRTSSAFDSTLGSDADSKPQQQKEQANKPGVALHSNKIEFSGGDVKLMKKIFKQFRVVPRRTKRIVVNVF
jgi:hypothetical protein